MVVCSGLEVWTSRKVCRIHYVHLWSFPWPKAEGARVLQLKTGFSIEEEHRGGGFG